MQDAMEPLVNSPHHDLFWRRNLIRTGSGSRRRPTIVFQGPLSIKGVLKGQIDWRTRERRHRVSPDTFVLLNDGQEYALSSEREDECRTFCAFFEKGFVERAVRALLDGPDQLLDTPESATSFGFFETLTPIATASGQAFRRLAGAVAAKSPPETLDWHFHALAAALARAALEARMRPQQLNAVKPATRLEINRRLLRARAAIEDELDGLWTLGRMAAEAAMAPHHFARCFRQCFGETPHRFVSRRRLERAEALLQSGRFNVTQACLEVGYRSLGSFSSAFRAHLGRSPSAVMPDENPAMAGRP
jgi:AraC family transcriptional regulator